MIYPFDCPDCKYYEEFIEKMADMPVDPICKKCGSVMKRNYNTDNKAQVFQGQWFEHIGPKPIYCESKKQLREACKKHGVYSVYLESGFNR